MPALVILGLGVEPTNALVWSQVVLSFALPGTLVPLLLFTRDRRLMGVLVNHRLTTAAPRSSRPSSSVSAPTSSPRLLTALLARPRRGRAGRRITA